MKLREVDPSKVELELYECQCGFHFGVDATYLDQVGDIELKCPSCEEVHKIPAFN
jgi:hypothetical protein